MSNMMARDMLMDHGQFNDMDNVISKCHEQRWRNTWVLYRDATTYLS